MAWWLPLVGVGASLIGGAIRGGLGMGYARSLPKPPEIDKTLPQAVKRNLEFQAQRWENYQPSRELYSALTSQVRRAAQDVFQQGRETARELARRAGQSPNSAYSRALYNQIMKEALQDAIRRRSQGQVQWSEMKEQYRQIGKEKASQFRLKKADVDLALWQAIEQRKMAQWQANVNAKMMEYQALMDAIAGVARGVGGALNTYFLANAINAGNNMNR